MTEIKLNLTPYLTSSVPLIPHSSSTPLQHTRPSHCSHHTVHKVQRPTTVILRKAQYKGRLIVLPVLLW